MIQIDIMSRKWTIDLNPNPNEQRLSTRLESQLEPIGLVDSKYIAPVTSETREARASNVELKLRKAWELAQSPSKSIFMTLFMAWMSGSSVNIFSIMITIYTFLNPTRAILSVNSAFSRFEDPQINLVGPKLVFILINLVTVGIAIYKCSVLGLLPTTVADWVPLIPVQQPMEYSAGMFVS